MDLHPISLRFKDKALEVLFIAQNDQRRISSNRSGIILSALAWCSFLLVGYATATPYLSQICMVVLPLLIYFVFVIASTYSSIVSKNSHILTALANIGAEATVVIIGFTIFPNAALLAGGTVLIIFFSHFILNVRYILSLVTSIINILFVECVLLIATTYTTTEVWYISLIILLGWMSGSAGGYLLEYQGRLNFILRRKLVEENEQLKEKSYRDPLTGLYNRGFFYEMLKGKIKTFKRQEKPFSLVMLDVDNFKRINDTMGHPVGDIVLQQCANLLIDSIRSTDVLARYGGEEFVILMDDIHEQQTLDVFRRLQKRVALHKFANVPWSLALSIGYSSYQADMAPEHLLKLAENSLKKAKEGGSNLIIDASVEYKSSGKADTSH